MATVPRKARRLSAEFRRSSDAVPHHASDAAASTGMKLERAATPPTPANVTWLRDHFQKAREMHQELANKDNTRSNSLCIFVPKQLLPRVVTSIYYLRCLSRDLSRDRSGRYGWVLRAHHVRNRQWPTHHRLTF
jgi:hypothetical protein